MIYPYEILGINEDADQKTIRKRFLELVVKHSPEKDPAVFQEISGAYAYLNDEIVREKMHLFGLKEHQDKDTKLSSLVRPAAQIKRIGIDAWMSLLNKG